MPGKCSTTEVSSLSLLWTLWVLSLARNHASVASGGITGSPCLEDRLAPLDKSFANEKITTVGLPASVSLFVVGFSLSMLRMFSGCHSMVVGVGLCLLHVEISRPSPHEPDCLLERTQSWSEE